jgi:hypothetical protein
MEDNMPRDGYIDIPLNDYEQIVREQTAGMHQVGGLLVVTNQRLLFRPMDLGLANDLIQYGLRLIGGHTALIGHFVSALVKYAELQRQAIPAEQITAVGPGSSQDALLVERTGGHSYQFHVSASPWSPRWSRKNEAARNELIREIAIYLS